MGNKIRTDTGHIEECSFFNEDDPVAQQVAMTTSLSVLPGGGIGTVLGAFNTEVARNDAIKAINNCLTRINEIETVFKNFGIMP